MASYNKTKEGENGWSEWFMPFGAKGKPYKFSCCDCGLVHALEFQIWEVRPIRSKGAGWWKGIKRLSLRKHRIRMRARREVRATAAVRRERRKVRK